jgi:outer membrane lipoprotein-sorting protein
MKNSYAIFISLVLQMTQFPLHNMFSYTTFITAVWLLLGSSMTFATSVQNGAHNLTSFQNPDDRGRGIIAEMISRDAGWGGAQATIQMTLRDKKGQQRLRSMRMKTLEISGDGDKSLAVFVYPKDLRGTALLTHGHITTGDDQWLYLPAIKRTKRIASRSKTGRFVGSEFTYEDMASFEIEKYSYQYLRDEIFQNLDCFVVEAYPQDRYSGYKRQQLWIDKNEYRIQKIVFFDKKDKRLKVLTHSEYQQHKGKHWRPQRSLLVNEQTGASTLLVWETLTFNTHLTPSDFDQLSLKRSR